jgi:hypothetical protein
VPPADMRVNWEEQRRIGVIGDTLHKTCGRVFLTIGQFDGSYGLTRSVYGTASNACTVPLGRSLRPTQHHPQAITQLVPFAP